MNNYKILELLKWYEKYNKIDLRINSKTKSFDINISISQLPHLLGLHYAKFKDNDKYLKGYDLYNFIVKNNISDEKIYSSIYKNSINMLNNVANRVNNFKIFMLNLEQGVIYEQTNPYTNLKSNYLILQTNDNKFIHLGIVSESFGDIITEFSLDELASSYLETFFIRNDDKYFNNSTIYEPISNILKYDEKINDFIPFSFDEEKNLKLLQENRKELEIPEGNFTL